MNSYESLLARVKQVRRRWRSQVLLRGISLFLASAIALLVLGVWGADLFGFRVAAVWLMRTAAGGTVLFVAWRFLYVPLCRRISDVQIAQFIEERYPQLEDRLVAAVEYGNGGGSASGLVDLLIKDALDKTKRVDFSVFVDWRRLGYFGSLGIGAFMALFALLTWGPPFFPYGFSRLYVPWTRTTLESSMMIKVVPGNIKIAEGSDQQIKAQLFGFDSPEVRLYLQPESSSGWSPVVMEPEPYGSRFLYLLIDIRSSLRYYVESKGVRSQIYSVRVLDLAKVETMDLTYNFPAYTGMEPQTTQNEGDIAALKGTKVDFKIHLNRPAASARLILDDRSSLDLAPSGPLDFTGILTLRRSGTYVIQLTEAGGKSHSGSPEYQIEAFDDESPKVSITKPMRDMRATNVEEVFSEIKAEDDIGMASVELHYSVNGEAEKTISLYNGKPRETLVIGTHTFFLEEFGLQPGDVIAYYGRGLDNNNATGPGDSSSDIYFIEVRPFEQKYTQSQQGASMEGGGGERQEALSQQQKEIISATFKLIRDKDKMAGKEYVESSRSLALVQSRLQAQTQGLVDRLHRRGAAEAAEDFGRLSEYLSNAVSEMEQAAVALGAQKPSEAMPKEQKSLQQLMRAESLFTEIQVSFGTQGGGSGSQANAEDLADLFELELNKLKNQYETVRRGEQQAREEELDEALQRLKELAQRQQQLNERNRMMGRRDASGSASAGGGGSQSQQQLAEEAEQLKRQLQRLSRQRSSQQLNEASRRLQKAIDEMKKALNGSQRVDGAESSAQGVRALQQLDEARRQLAGSQNAGLKQGVEQAKDESERLVQEQNRIRQQLDGLASDELSAGSSELKRRAEDLVSRKTVLADRLKNLQKQIEDLSRLARKSQKETSSRLSEAAGMIRDKKLPERIMSGNALIEKGYYDIEKGREDFVSGSLEDLKRRLDAANESVGQTEEERLEEAANRARQLAEGLESMQQRLGGMQRGRQQGESERQQQARQGQPGHDGSLQSARGQLGRNGQNLQSGIPELESDVRGPSRDAIGSPTGIGVPGVEDARQLRREFGQRLLDAQDLRRLLDRNSTQMENLDKVIESLRKAGDYVNYSDPERSTRLRSAIDFMRQVEFDLARDLERLTQEEKYFFSEDSEAPANYQKLVEEYYKSIARGKQ